MRAPLAFCAHRPHDTCCCSQPGHISVRGSGCGGSQSHRAGSCCRLRLPSPDELLGIELGDVLVFSVAIGQDVAQLAIRLALRARLHRKVARLRRRMAWGLSYCIYVRVVGQFQANIRELREKVRSSRIKIKLQ